MVLHKKVLHTNENKIQLRAGYHSEMSLTERPEKEEAISSIIKTLSNKSLQSVLHRKAKREKLKYLKKEKCKLRV